MHPFDQGAVALSRAIRARQVSSEEAVRLSLERIAARDPELASFVEVWDRSALAEARRKDARPSEAPAFPDEDGDGDGGGGAGGDDDDGGGGGGGDDDDVEVVEIDAGTVPAPSSGGCDGDGCSSTRRTGGCSGCDGGGGCAADGGGASCDCQGQACATLPVGPGAVGLTILVFLRRRPTRGSR